MAEAYNLILTTRCSNSRFCHIESNLDDLIKDGRQGRKEVLADRSRGRVKMEGLGATEEPQTSS